MMQCNLHEAMFLLPNSDYQDSTINIFSSKINEHSFVINRKECLANSTLEEAVTYELNEASKEGFQLNEVARQTRYITDNHKRTVEAILIEFQTNIQGRLSTQQQFYVQVRGITGKPSMLIFTYTQSGQLTDDDLDRVLKVWDSVEINV